MHFNGTITLDGLIFVASQVILFVAVWSGFKARVDAMLASQKELLEHLRLEFKEHEQQDTTRFQAYDASFRDLIGGLNRLLGQSESPFRRGMDRRTT